MPQQQAVVFAFLNKKEDEDGNGISGEDYSWKHNNQRVPSPDRAGPEVRVPDLLEGLKYSVSRLTRLFYSQRSCCVPTIANPSMC